MDIDTAKLRALIERGDHTHGCQGRSYTCTCGYDDLVWGSIEALPALLDELDALRACIVAADAMARPLADHGDTDAYLAARAALRALERK